MSAPSPLYLLLTHPESWVQGTRVSDVVRPLEDGAWAFDPNETPEGHLPLLPAFMDAFRTSRLSRPDSPWFRRITVALIAAGAHPPDATSPVVPPHAQAWWKNVSRQGPAHVHDLSLAHRAAELTKEKGAQLKHLRDWCAKEGLDLRTPLAGAPLLAHLAASAYSSPLDWRQRLGHASDGWAEMGRAEGSSIQTNQNSAAQRVSDMVVLHDWLGLNNPLKEHDPQVVALWWLMAWPLVNGANTGNGDGGAIVARFFPVNLMPALRAGLDGLVAEPWPMFEPRLSALILAGLPSLLPSTPAEKVWGWAVECLKNIPGTPLGPVDPGAPGLSIKPSSLTYAAHLVERICKNWGWPGGEWNAAQRQPLDLAVPLWRMALGRGEASGFTPELARAWYAAALTDPTLAWPTQDEVRQWFGKNGPNEAAVQAVRRDAELHHALPEPASARRGPRM